MIQAIKNVYFEWCFTFRKTEEQRMEVDLGPTLNQEASCNGPLLAKGNQFSLRECHWVSSHIQGRPKLASTKVTPWIYVCLLFCFILFSLIEIF